MKYNIYSIHDSATEAYSRPFFAQADGEAVRQFGDIANDETHPIGKHPEHYKLFRIGTFDDQTAKLNPEEPSHLANGHEAVTQHHHGNVQEISPGLTA